MAVSERYTVLPWRQQNQPTQYPFAEYCALTSDQGMRLPVGLIVDAVFYPAGGSSVPYCSSIELDALGVRFVWGDSSTLERCSGQVSWLAPTSEVPLVDAHGRAAGVLVLDTSQLAALQTWGSGEYTFERRETEVVPAVWLPQLEGHGVRGLRLPDGRILTGAVWLVGGAGVLLRGEQVGSAWRIRVDVIGDPLLRRRLCSPTEWFATPRFVRRVRFRDRTTSFVCTPDANGHIQIVSQSATAPRSVLRLRLQGEHQLLLTAAGGQIGG